MLTKPRHGYVGDGGSYQPNPPGTDLLDAVGMFASSLGQSGSERVLPQLLHFHSQLRTNFKPKRRAEAAQTSPVL